MFAATEGFWEKVGNKLELLDIFELKTPKRSISHIEKHCRRLTSVQIFITHGNEIRYLNLLESYGTQLKYAYVLSSPIEHIKSMANACPNARFSFQIGSGIRQRFVSRTAILKTLGLQLESVMAVYPIRQSNALNERVDWSACSNIEHVNLIDPSKVDISAFFETPKPKLRSISIQCSFDNDGLQRLMRRISLCTGALEDLCMIVRNEIPPEVFTDLVQRNSSLSFVRITPADTSMKRDRKLIYILMLDSKAMKRSWTVFPSCATKIDSGRFASLYTE